MNHLDIRRAFDSSFNVNASIWLEHTGVLTSNEKRKLILENPNWYCADKSSNNKCKYCLTISNINQCPGCGAPK